MGIAVDNSTPLALAKSFLACIKARDTESMRKLILPDAFACLIRQGKPVYIKIDDIITRIGSITVEQDEYSYDEVEHVDGDYATVWTPFTFDEAGKLHHTGTNTFCCWKHPEQGWVITVVTDVGRLAEGITTMSIVGGE